MTELIDLRKYGIDLNLIKHYVDYAGRRMRCLENKLYYTPKRVFVCGLSASGKDTIANYLRDEHDFAKFRLASSIKNQIVETNGFEGYEELEFWKRKYPEIRRQHTKIGDDLTRATKDISKKQVHNNFKHYSLNMCYLFATRKHGIFEICNNIPQNYVICDVRMPEEIYFLLRTGHFGIFLTRDTSEYKVNGHITETNIFTNGLYEDMKKLFGKQMFLINNPVSGCVRDYHNEFYKKNLNNDVWNLDCDVEEDEFLDCVKSFVLPRING